MDLNLVRTFMAVYQCQSYTKASELLMLTQPAVSAAIKRLESEIGKQLFIKKGRGIEATSKAHALATKFQFALDTINDAVNDKNTLSVYCAEIILHSLVGLEQINFAESPRSQSMLFEHLREQKVDLVLDVATMKDSAFVIEDAYVEPLVVVCAKNHPRIQGELTKVDYYRESHVIYSALWQGMNGFEQIAQEPVEERNIALTVSSLSSVLMFVSQGDSLGLVSQSFAKRWEKQLNLAIYPCPVKLDNAKYKFIYHKRYINDPQHRKVRQQIIDKLSKKKPFMEWMGL
ncbi:transcriptional regulator, LysR family [Aliivibrio fischeri ES114]|uniref:Transcriptional regulator, LysR family n=1 Tax=Aliivibrio fischeri (strain ATCC 700601 / ES114) TaxID=312309 RepID=Q5DZ29_ALIF1|nr:LysR family transcriptional regulator [Aliivibrio fischeri]AAW87967.1 transcriptional regulator, LysR family [Aliivibrio fischeri ES114]KLU80452.1 LysR family transcriptional regulator [Aliivibrio fischeri]MCE7565455.1 LysR family transcriptional regulator [Aliivibrio fischeri]